MNIKFVVFFVFVTLLVGISAISFAYSIQLGYFDQSYGVMLSQPLGMFYVSTGMSANSVAFLINQRLGLTWQKKGSVSFRMNGGADISLLMAFNKTNGILFSLFGEGEIEYNNFELSVGVFKGLKAINDSKNFVSFNACAPEVKVGYRW